MFERLPSVSSLLETPPLRTVLHSMNRMAATTQVRQLLDRWRNEIPQISTWPPHKLAERLARWLVEKNGTGSAAVLNATGIVFPVELAGPALAPTALEVWGRSASVQLRREPSANLDETLCQAVRHLTGAEAALLVTNIAAAHDLLWSTRDGGVGGQGGLLPSGGVIVARREVADLLPGYDVATAIRLAGRSIVDIGTATTVIEADYVTAAKAGAVGLLRVHATDMPILEKSPTPPADRVAAAGRAAGVLTAIHLTYGLPRAVPDVPSIGEPTIAEAIADGFDVVIAPTDGLLGGPTGALLVGRRAVLEALAKHPARCRAAASQATREAVLVTLALHADAETVAQELPPLMVLTVNPETLRSRASRLAPRLAACPDVTSAEIVTANLRLSDRQTGPATSAGVAIEVMSSKASEIRDALAGQTPAFLVEPIEAGTAGSSSTAPSARKGAGPIVGLRVHLGTLLPSDDLLVAEAFRQATGAALLEIEPPVSTEADTPPVVSQLT